MQFHGYSSCMADTDVLLDVAAEADFWDFAIRLDEDSDGGPHISARCFNTVVHFIAPTDDKPAWQLAEQRLASKQPERLRAAGAVTTAQVIDSVPGALEGWVLRATRGAADLLLAADEWVDDPAEAARLRDDGLRLVSEWEQAEAHSRRWQERLRGQYGDIVLYELSDDEPIFYERTYLNGKEALLMGHSLDRLGVVLVAPDSEHPWRRSTPERVEEHGRRISVREAIDYAGDAHHDWVVEQTALALGDTLRALREVQIRALDGRDPLALAELTRLAGHAGALSEGLQPPAIGPPPLPG
jgi:hypothetical protein